MKTTIILLNNRPTSRGSITCVISTDRLTELFNMDSRLTILYWKIYTEDEKNAFHIFSRLTVA